MRPSAIVAVFPLVIAAAARDARADQPPLTEPPAKATQDADSTPVKEPPESRRFISIAGGFAFQSLYGVPITAGGVEFLFDRGHPGVGVLIDGTYGSTEGGLHVGTFTAGALVQGFVGRFRYGVGARIGAFDATRVTTDGSFFSFMLGACARASIDLLHGEDLGGLFVFASASADFVGGPVLGATGGLGVRF
jgi:hypothetical protein